MKGPQHSGDIPVIEGKIAMRNPIRVLLLNPWKLPIVFALFITSVVFTIWPQALNHAAISFEIRSVWHHVWHYTLLVGSLTTLVGLLSASANRLRIELMGLILLGGAVAINLIAVITSVTDEIPDDVPVSGYGVALRAAVLVGIFVQLYIFVREPTVAIPVSPIKAEGE